MRPEIESFGLRSEINNQNERRNIRDELKQSLSKIYKALQVKEIHNVIYWMALYALLVPNFGGFDYYFMLDVVGITQFQYSMISVLHYLCMFIGSYLFRRWLKDFEVRTLTVVEVLMGLLCAPFTMLFVTRQNLLFGISDGFIIIFTDIIGDIFSMCLVVLPICVLFAKITPRKIEATCFAMLAGLYNFKNSIRGYIGTTINTQFIGVSRENMDDFWKLKVISLVCSCLPLLFIFLLPSQRKIENLQKRMAEEEALELAAAAEVKERRNMLLECEEDEEEEEEEKQPLLEHRDMARYCRNDADVVQASARLLSDRSKTSGRSLNVPPPPLETIGNLEEFSGENDDEVKELVAESRR